MNTDQPIFLVVGPPAVGKSTTARALAARFPRSIHIPVDDLRMMVVSGLALPAAEWSDELAQQVTLARVAASHMALSYATAGFPVVIDDFWDPNSDADYRALRAYSRLHRIVLYPAQEIAHRRNQTRAAAVTRAYIDEGIRIVYEQLRGVLPQLQDDGWLVVDTAAIDVADTVTEILRRADRATDTG